MDWDQIESKWAAMARRVRGDVSIIKVDATGKTPRRLAKADAAANIGADRPSGENADPKITMLAQ
ncbi:hypothetical protein [Tabrizicola sp.]|uniref:hypothetical protein n=1 Tax=Tabrizicola sp. TaxID=2005166 RepID=UPI00286D2BA7|nr:hypothetical protein [Tabrizicola sp.]